MQPNSCVCEKHLFCLCTALTMHFSSSCGEISVTCLHNEGFVWYNVIGHFRREEVDLGEILSYFPHPWTTNIEDIPLWDASSLKKIPCYSYFSVAPSKTASHSQWWWGHPGKALWFSPWTRSASENMPSWYSCAWHIEKQVLANQYIVGRGSNS